MMSSSTGKIMVFESYEKGLNAYVELLVNNYFAKGRDTIEKIGNIYCPVGATNDPNNLNQYWIPKVNQYYNEYVN